MPYLKIQTNCKVVDKQDLLAKSSSALGRILNKSEDKIMVKLEESADMYFAQSTNPCLFIELKSLSMDESKTSEISKGLCTFFHQELNVSTERIYIEFSHGARHMWGWNNKTFGDS